MKVILLIDIKNVGRKGSVIEVAPGMAQNSLFPQKKALPATPENVRKFAAQVQDVQGHREAQKAKAEKAAGSIPDTVKFELQATDAGSLFRTVDAKFLKNEIAKKHSIVLTDVDFDLDAAIKSTGEYQVRVIYTPAKSLIRTITLVLTGKK